MFDPDITNYPMNMLDLFYQIAAALIDFHYLHPIRQQDHLTQESQPATKCW